MESFEAALCSLPGAGFFEALELLDRALTLEFLEATEFDLDLCELTP